MACLAALAGRQGKASAAPPSAVVADLEHHAAAVHAAAAGHGDAGIRGTLRFALEAAGNDWNPAAVEEALRLARSMQDTAPGSPAFGNYRWRKNDAAVSDLNAVEFATELSALLRLEHADRLTPAARDLLDAMHRDALVGMRNHEVRPGYTNIYLKKVFNHLALGRVCGEEVTAAGRRLWSDWLTFTRTDGLREFTSPTYYGVTLDSLALIRRLAPDAAVRREAEASLLLVWSSIAANWFSPAERLSGPHSRDYDYLFGRGYVDEHLADAGWLSAPPAPDAGGWLAGMPRGSLRVLRDACRWEPPATLRDGPLGEEPRFVVQRFNHAPWGRATNWVSRTCSIGVAGECAGPEDKTLVINLPGDRATPNVVLVFDGRGDPYGRVRKPVGYDGHHKSHHLKPFVIASQRGRRVTAAWYFDPEKLPPGARDEPLDCLQAHLLLPADAEIWSADVPLSDSAALPAAGVVFLRRGDVAVGVRSLALPDGEAAPGRMEIHADGGQSRAKRITAVYAEGQPTRPALLALDIELCDACDDAAFAAFCGEFAARDVSATLVDGRLRIDGALPLEADLVRYKRIASEPLMTPDTLLRVNDHEVGLPLLSTPPP
ncbi:MAG: hypothetical protein EBZ74_02390 [Planctomycetia bacterium]|nr:hypothetical protein [Planctomycetia bacterium]